MSIDDALIYCEKCIARANNRRTEGRHEECRLALEDLKYYTKQALQLLESEHQKIRPQG